MMENLQLLFNSMTKQARTAPTWGIEAGQQVKYIRNMSKSKGWTLQSSLSTLWMDENSNQQSHKNC